MRKTLIALAAAGTMALGLTASAGTAEAKHRYHRNNDVDIFFGFPFFGQGYYDDYYYGDNYRYRHRANYHCHWVKVKKKFHKKRWVKRCHSSRHRGYRDW
jgi:hypothetical protein